MRAICATITQHSVITGIAYTRRNWPKVAMSSVRESADSQCSLTAKTSSDTAAIRNSGTDTVHTVATLTTRSNSDPRYIADRMPRASATGTDTAVVAADSISE